ncbi:MAG: glycerol kinase, partial [Ferruginibacter sp.]
IMNTTVVRPVITETTALGAAYLAGLAVGYWPDMESIQNQWQVDKKFVSAMEEEERKALTKQWQRSVKTAKAWADDE